MAISKQRKEELVAQYTRLLEESNGLILVNYRGLGVTQVDQLREKIREAGGQYIVTKTTLFIRALNDVGWPVPEDMLNGPLAVAFGRDNTPGVAKAVLEFTKDQAEKIQTIGGILAGDVINASRVETVSKLPTLDELRSQLAGLVVAPATGLVSVLYAANSQIVNVVQAYLDDKNGDAA